MSDVTIQQLKDFLSVEGWSQFRVPSNYLEIWRKIDDSGWELLLPTDCSVDKDLMLHTALQKLAGLGNEVFSEVVRKVRELTGNILSIRVSHADVQDGSIPLEDGIALNANAKELLAAAACAALERRPLYQGRLPVPVAELIKRARLGQTAQGSYVVNVFCNEFHSEENGPDFSRVATSTLGVALTGLKSALDEYERGENPIAFEEALRRGASANLCEAISKFSGKDRSRSVEITLISSNAGLLIGSPRVAVNFSPSQQPYLKVAADYFRKTYTLHNQTIVGVVEILERRAEQEAGAVRIFTTLSNGAKRSVKVQLEAADYPTAIAAHGSKQLVRISGTVVVTPRTANMVNSAGFAVLGSHELFPEDP